MHLLQHHAILQITPEAGQAKANQLPIINKGHGLIYGLAQA